MAKPSRKDWRACSTEPHKILVSYHYYKKVKLAKWADQFDRPLMIFADSGAYSAESQGATIDIKEYMRWLEQEAACITTYANLDVIGDAAATHTNQIKMEKSGFVPMPVFHAGEELKWLDRYLEKYPLIGLGGLVGRPKAASWSWIVKVFRRARERNSPAVFHGFGTTTFKIVADLPWYSVDSSTWGVGFRYAEVFLFDPWKLRLVRARLFNPQSVAKRAEIIRFYGGDPERLKSRDGYRYSYIAALSARSWQQFELYCRLRHGEIGLPGQSGGLHAHMAMAPSDGERLRAGLHLYLADSNTTNHRYAIEGIK